MSLQMLRIYKILRRIYTVLRRIYMEEKEVDLCKQWSLKFSGKTFTETNACASNELLNKNSKSNSVDKAEWLAGQIHKPEGEAGESKMYLHLHH